MPFLQRSRLAGFFLSFTLAACQPEKVPQPGALEYQKAQQALAAHLPLKATEHLALAARQGHPAAALAWLQQSSDRLGPLAQYQQLKDWHIEVDTPQIAHQLGLWQSPQAKPAILPQLATAGRCRLSVLPVLSSARSLMHWQSFVKNWPDSQLAALPICFARPQLLDSRQLRCSEKPAQRVQCDALALSVLVQNTNAQLLMVVAGRGQASFNNGWLQLPEDFSPALFTHEFSHALGFLDEYALSAGVAADECQRKDLMPNLLLESSDLARYARHWQLEEDEIQLTPVNTCQAVGRQAYRPVAADSHMQHYELPVPPLYLQLMARQLGSVSELMPVQYYFAYLARQRGDMTRWQQLMQQAATLGYPPAQGSLTAAGLNWTAR